MARAALLELSYRLYSLLLRAYPGAYRRQFAAPMTAAFRERCAEQVTGPRSALRVWLHEFPDLLYRGTRERLGPGAGHLQPRSPTTRPRMAQPIEWISSLLQDLAHAGRMLRRRPTYTLIILATLVLGIGMNTAVFSVLYGVLLQPLPFAEPERLVRIGRAAPDSDWLNPISASEFRDLETRLELFDSVAAVSSSGQILTAADEAELVYGAMASSELFEMLGAYPQLGRFFGPGDADPASDRVLVVSDAFWRTRLGGDPAVLGSTVELGGTPYTVIGVAAPGFTFRPSSGLSGAEYWEPLRWTDAALAARHSHYLMIFGRVAAGASVEAASQEVAAVWRELVAPDPGTHLDPEYELGMRAVSLREFSVRGSRDPLLFLTGAVALVLLIACVNVVNLMLTNAESRRHEFVVRAAIGAGRGRLVRQVLTEAITLAGIGGALGVLGAELTVRAVMSAFPAAVPRSGEVGLHLPVLGFAVAVTLLTAVVLGLATSLQAARGSLVQDGAGRVAGGPKALFRKGLIVAEAALALILVVGAGLMVKSYWKASGIDLGFDADGLFAVNVTLPAERYATSEAPAAFFDAFAEALAARPEVEAVGMTSMVPIRSFGNNISGVRLAGRPERHASYVELRYVTASYFDTLGLPILRGRGLTPADVDSPTPVAVINQTLARRLMGEDDPVGERLAIDPDVEIVGVVGDLRGFGPDRELAPYMYLVTPYANNVMVRLRPGTEELVPQLRRIARDVDAEARVWRIESMETIAADALGNRRFQLAVIGVFAGVALLLGAVGTYGVMAYTIERQMREFGIRIAVGAAASDIRRLVLTGAGGLAALGIALGLLGAFALRRYVASLLFEVQPWDPAVYGGTALAMALVAALACWLPARRAAAADPVQILRRE